MKNYLKRPLAAIIAAAMIMSSTAAVYADDDLSLQDDESTISVSSEIETDDAATDNNEEIVPASETSGTCGDNLTWTLVDGTLTISGTGDTYNYNYGKSPWYNSEPVSKVILTEGVTSIGDYLFLNCTELESITVPDSLISVGKCAFQGCIGLTNIELPDGVSSLGKYAFFECTALTKMAIPEGVTSIETGLFGGCNSLAEINIPAGVTWIGANAFDGCSSLKEIDVPKGMTSIGDYAFYGCYGLKKITIPDGVTSIGENAFTYCKKLEEIIIPAGVTSIGEEAFYGCNKLKTIQIPGSVTVIGDKAFDHCGSLADIYFDGSMEMWSATSEEYGKGIPSVLVHCTDGVIEYRSSDEEPEKNPAHIYNGVDYSAVYDYEYFHANQDVADAFGDDDVATLANFIRWGMTSGRQGNEEFNVNIYMKNYPELVKVYGSNLSGYYMHYIYWGKAAGLVANELLPHDPVTEKDGVDYSAVYDYEYFHANQDVADAFGDDDVATLNNFIRWGMTTGRQGNEEFNVKIYMANYPELKSVYGDNLAGYYMHYIYWGKDSGLIADQFLPHTAVTVKDGIDYSDVYDYNYFHANKDVADAFGDDDVATLANFVRWGMTTGRQGSAEFNVYTYMNNYPELKDVYGDNLAGYYMHYIWWGKAAGWVANEAIS